MSRRDVPALRWLRALQEPARVLEWSLAEWEWVVRMARRQRLLARLAAAVAGAGLHERVPAPARRHLVAEARLSHDRTTALVWALDRVAASIGGCGFPLVLLKGGAYIGQDLPIALGRLPSDVDILVPRAAIDGAQRLLVEAGWDEVELDDYDRRYYHEWSHEVPPMRHPAHRIELDLHHNILPPIGRTHVDADRLLERLQPSKWPEWRVLHPIDQVLHSAAHLYTDSEPRDRLRDLADLDGLLRHFGRDPAFWDELPERARMLGLAEPLALASHFCGLWLGTAIPASALACIERLGPSRARRAWLLPMLEHALMPADVDGSARLRQRFAATVFLVRHHRNRMPARMLIAHTWHKLRTRAVEVDATQAPADDL